MKTSALIVFSGMLALATGCGGDDSPGSGGTGGASSGGGAGDGAGGDSTSTGGSTTGGASGGRAGGLGGAGGNGNSPQCPDAAPATNADCTGLEGETCTYESTGCVCVQFGMNAGTWQCSDAGGQCANDEPASGACTEGDICSHTGGDGFCFCPQGGPNEGLWVCPGM
jgi:hypothetical protein